MKAEAGLPFGSWAVWALASAIFAKVGVRGVDSDLATLTRILVVACALALSLTSAERLQPAALSPRTLIFMALFGLMTGASWSCYFRALKVGEASRVVPVDKLSVVLVALFGAAFLGERLSVVNWLGVALSDAGMLLVALR